MHIKMRLHAVKEIGLAAAVMVLLLSAVTLLPVRANAQADLTFDVRAFITAMNSGDVDAAAFRFSDQPEAVMAGRNGTVTGLAAIRAELQREIDEGVNLTPLSIVVASETLAQFEERIAYSLTVVATNEVRMPAITDFGIDRIIQVDTFIFHACACNDTRPGSVIVSLSRTLDTSDPDTARFLAAQGGGPGGLPSAGSGGLADRSGGGAWVALTVAGILAMMVGATSIAARIATRRRR